MEYLRLILSTLVLESTWIPSIFSSELLKFWEWAETGGSERTRGKLFLKNFAELEIHRFCIRLLGKVLVLKPPFEFVKWKQCIQGCILVLRLIFLGTFLDFCFGALKRSTSSDFVEIISDTVFC